MDAEFRRKIGTLKELPSWMRWLVQVDERRAEHQISSPFWDAVHRNYAAELICEN